MALLFGAAAALPTAAAGKLRIATTGDRPPFGRVDDSGEVRGLDVEIALALCEGIRAECEIGLHAWERPIPELRPGNAAAIAASMSITGKRRALVAFTAPYYANTVRFVARRGSDFDLARLAGAKVGVMRATISADWFARNGGDRVAVRLFRDQATLRMALTAATVDAVMGDGLGLHDWLAGPVGRRFGQVGAGLRLDEGIGIAVRPEDRAPLQRPNRALRAIFANGVYERINARCLPFGIQPE